MTGNHAIGTLGNYKERFVCTSLQFDLKSSLFSNPYLPSESIFLLNTKTEQFCIENVEVLNINVFLVFFNNIVYSYYIDYFLTLSFSIIVVIYREQFT